MIYINNNFKVGIYIRLSKEDNNKKFIKESESIINQRNLLLAYIKDHNLKLIDEYIDDGYSGTNFERPGFEKMLNDIENKKINMVITKDLSRLGRDYIQSGYYLEHYFPSRKIRYVSILDNIDTWLDDNSDIAPFKALFNDLQSKDISKKIRSVLNYKKEQGLFLGNHAAYGYQKDPLNKYHLIIDPKTAPIVRKIFNLAKQGKTNKEIATILNNAHILTPIIYQKRKYLNVLKNHLNGHLALFIIFFIIIYIQVQWFKELKKN